MADIVKPSSICSHRKTLNERFDSAEKVRAQKKDGVTPWK